MVAPTSATGDPRASVLDGNRAVHAIEAQYYDRVHSDIFNFWEQRMLARDLAHALSLLPSPPARLRALDVGCGTGQIALRLWRLGHTVDGVDLSPEMLDRLRAKGAEDARLRLHLSDADTFLQAAESYDLIAFSSVLHHLPDYRSTLKRCVEVLAPGGVLFVTHEPLPRAERRAPALVHRAVSRAADLVDRARLKLGGISMPAIDYALSDVHVEEGIALESLRALLDASRLQVVGLRRYRTERLGLAAWLNNAVLHVPPALFSLVARREPSGEGASPT